MNNKGKDVPPVIKIFSLFVDLANTLRISMHQQALKPELLPVGHVAKLIDIGEETYDYIINVKDTCNMQQNSG